MFKIQKLDFLISFYIFCICASELMGGKTFPLLNAGPLKLNANVAIFLFPFIFSINDIITEVYGKERTRSLIRTSILIVLFIFLFTIFATSLPPSGRFIPREAAYDMVFGLSTRIAAASLIAFSLAEFLDVLVFSKIREKLGKSKLWFRTNASNFASQFIDTIVFMTLAFYALDQSIGSNVAFLFSLILPYWLLKCLMSVIETPIVYAGVKWLKSDK
jgi:queuosine precursor transporter